MIHSELNSSLNWLDERRSDFSIAHSSKNTDLLSSIKPIGELVLLLEKARSFSESHARTAEWAWGQFDNGELILQILVANPDLIVISTIYASFKKLGFVNGRLDKAVKYYLNTSYCTSLEMPEWRRLDVQHARVSLGLEPQSSVTLAATCLYSHPEPWMVSVDTAYAVTHEIFYVTDFGNRQPCISTEMHNYLLLVIDTWLRIFHRKKNFDLIAEFLMCAQYLGFTDLYDAWLPKLIGWQRDDGCFPGPDESAQNIITDDMKAHRIDFLQNYHTTIVASLALLAKV